MKKLIIAAGLLMTTSAYAQTEVLTGVTRGKDYGVVYSLPKTQIELEIKANKVNYTPGEFSKYADRYLRLTNVSADPEEYWELASVKVKSVGVPNSETTYFVKLKDKTVAPLMELTEDGIVKTINVPYSNSSAGKKAAPAPAVLQKKANPREFEYPFCQMDDITLKTMVRSNPGLMLIKNGTILNKWSDEDIPDEYVLTDKL